MKRIFTLLAIVLATSALAQPLATKYGASPLELSSKKQWEKQVRPAVMEFFQQEVYGKVPPTQPKVSFRPLGEGEAFGGKV
ncbi:MAG: hypothetical protein IKT75_01020, partial [Alistipes sp.]|nr:hypothetical protein [Alistipes sp.]